MLINNGARLESEFEKSTAGRYDSSIRNLVDYIGCKIADSDEGKEEYMPKLRTWAVASCKNEINGVLTGYGQSIDDPRDIILNLRNRSIDTGKLGYLHKIVNTLGLNSPILPRCILANPEFGEKAFAYLDTIITSSEEDKAKYLAKCLRNEVNYIRKI